MKTRKTISTAIYFLLAALVGFLVGIFVNFPSMENNEVSGTIGKVSKYRNVTVTEADIQLRSELINNIDLLDGYTNFYSFHYLNVAELTGIIDEAMLVCDNDNNFSEQTQKALSGLKSYRKSIERPRVDLMLAMLTLQNINDIDQAAIIQILNNANIAIVQLNYNEGAVSDFAMALRDYIVANNDKNLDQLIEVHDKLVVLQIGKAIITKDKPMLKFYDQHEFFSNTGKLNVFGNVENITNVMASDCAVIKNSINNQTTIGTFSIDNFNAQAMSNQFLGRVIESINNFESAGSNSDLNSNSDLMQSFLNNNAIFNQVLGSIGQYINNIESASSKFDLNFSSDVMQNVLNNNVENFGVSNPF